LADTHGLNLNANPDAMRDVLETARTIAVVGHSDRPERTSYQIAAFLRRAGYTVYPVNPTLDEIDGERCYHSLHELPERVDIVNVFRRSEYLGEVVEEAIAAKARTVWAQLGVEDAEAQARALAAGVNIAMNTCIKVDYIQLGVRDAG
jgi:uncharacterized protein